MTSRWLVLIHHLPPKPDYLRVKIRRKLQRIGAVALKNSVYVLPSIDEALEDFQRLRREITAEGGQAMLLDSNFIEGVPNGALEQMARDERDREYRELLDAVKSPGAASDQDATFRFVTGDHPVTESHEIRFDMFDGGFTHIGDRCTLEVLVHHFGLTDSALNVIAEVVHDIDIKDGKFSRPETDGVAVLIDGIVTTVLDDVDRLEAGAQLFDRLYAAFARKAA